MKEKYSQADIKIINYLLIGDNMIKISTSILSAKDRIKSIKILNSTNTNYIHIDTMDNKFVPNYQLPIDEINELAKYSRKKFDIHLMTEDPMEYIKRIKCNNIINNIVAFYSFDIFHWIFSH